MIVVSAADRLWRQPLEQEQLISDCLRLGVSRLTSLRRNYGLSTDDLDMLRIEGVFRLVKSGGSSVGSSRRMLQEAEAGEFHGGPTALWLRPAAR